MQGQKGYQLKSKGEVNFVVYWQMEEGVEVRVVLPEVGFRWFNVLKKVSS